VTTRLHISFTLSDTKSFWCTHDEACAGCRKPGSGGWRPTTRAASPPWELSSAQIAAKLGVGLDRGLTESQAVRRRSRFGRNRLREVKARGAWQIAADQLRSIIIGLLAVAAALAFVFGDWMDGIAILIVLVLNALIGFFTELRAVRSMEALKRLSLVSAKVRREDTVREIPAEELVPGDVAVFMEGDIVSADVRLHKTSRLQADESALTGESVPVSKHTAPLEPGTLLHARSNMLFKGTVITRGTADGIVTATGMHTELGQIARLVAEAEQEITPLEKRLDQLGRKLVWLTLGVTAAVVVAGVSAGRNLLLMVETGIALAVAAVSEGLPIVTTIALARGVSRMADRNALLSRLSAIETLGSTSVIFTDKTGTLTENRMTVTHIALASSDVELRDGEDAPRFLTDHGGIDTVRSHELREALEAAVLCNNASLEQPGSGQNESGVGDPLEIALLAAGAKAGLGRRELLQRFPEQRQEAFERDEKMMATFHASGSGSRVAVKGAPEAVLAHCTRWFTEEGTRALGEEDLRRWQQRNVELAARGLRVLALARKNAAGPDAEPYSDLEFVGLLGMADPPRRDVRRAIQDCRTAGVRVVMVTGDQPATARAIANAVGLTSDATAEVI
jgi:Ca2+-transporting ATPase